MLERLKAMLVAVCFGIFVSFYLEQVWEASTHPQQYHNIHDAKGAPEDKSNKVTSDERIAYWTVWLTIFTGLLAIVSGVQSYFLLRADKTARMSANAAKDSVDLAGDTAKRQLRAYINIHRVNIDFHAWTDDPQIDIIFKNFGATPAHDIVIFFNILIAQNDGTAIEKFEQSNNEPDLGPTQKTCSTFMYPRGNMFLHIDEIKNKTERFIVWGKITYFDTFGKGPWQTEFRYRLPVDATGVKNRTDLVVDGRNGNICT